MSWSTWKEIAGFVLIWSSACVTAAAEPFSHEDWTTVLRAHVDEQGLVDYQGLAGDRELLDRYLAAIRTTGPRTSPAAFATRDHELAYYLNAYNALVFEGVLARGPETKSVWTGGPISGYRFFVGTRVMLDGQTTNLRKLENKQIREKFHDVRIHAALNCGSLGCPRLRREAFEAESLDRRLDEALREFVNEPRNVEIDDVEKSVTLSKIFDWFKGDFLAEQRETADGSPKLIDYINRYRDPADQVPAEYRIGFLRYDKRINGR
jgi:hypothetical protein